MPVYNVEKYLERSIKSVLNQTFPNFELICVNDGSTDKSGHILQQIQAHDKRIKIITQKNQGLSMARNNGLKQAQGDYVYFIDSDDAIHPQTFEICMHFAKKYEAELICFGFEKSDGESFDVVPFNQNQINAVTTTCPLDFLLQSGSFKISLNVWTKFYKKELIKDISFIKGVYYEDGPYTTEVLLKHPKTVILDAKLYLYTQNMGSISNQKIKMKHLQDYHTVVEKINALRLSTAQKKDSRYIQQIIFPRYLNNQYKCCLHANTAQKSQMLQYFAESLRKYKKEQILTLKGCGIFKYFRYLFLMHKY